MKIKTFVLISVFLFNAGKSVGDVAVYDSSTKLVVDFDDEPAGFGPSFPSAGLKGLVITTNPKNGCTRISRAPDFQIPGYQWIALIPRTKFNESCDFDLKVQNAQDANFSGVIVYNYEDNLITMGSHGRSIKIPAAMISHSNGLALIANFIFNVTTKNLSSADFYVKISAEPMFRFGSYLVPFASIIGVAFLVVLGFSLIKCYLQRRRTRRHRLPRSALKQLKTKKFVKGDRWEVCAICLDDYVDGAKLRILPCEHAYHMKCIDPWLLNSRRQCPVCKRYVFPNHDSSDEENSGQRQTRPNSEQTPLIQPEESPAAVERPRTRHFREQRFFNAADSSESDENPSLLTRSTVNNDRSTTSRPLSRPGRLRHLNLPRRSSNNENENNVTNYGSTNESPAAPFTTPRSANFFVGSVGGATDNTNVSARSTVDFSSDIETIDDTTEEENVHSVLVSSASNAAYLDEDEPSRSNQLRTNV